MNRRQLQAASENARKRAVALGEAGDTGAIGELLALCRHAGPTVRRAAASALGKLATDSAVRAAVPALCELARDAHPQVRQYAMLALGKIGDEAALPALRDAANRPAGPNCVLAAAIKAVEQIEALARAQRESAPIACSRCERQTSTDERRLSETQFQRVYWGMDTTDYKIGMLLKQKLYQQEGKRLISLYPADLPVLDTKLAGELKAMADIEQTRSQK